MNFETSNKKRDPAIFYYKENIWDRGKKIEATSKELEITPGRNY